MLEKQLSAILASNLGHFICDLNEEQLRISLWSGDLVLRNLQLQPDIVEQLVPLLMGPGSAGGQGSSSNSNPFNSSGADWGGSNSSRSNYEDLYAEKTDSPAGSSSFTWRSHEVSSSTLLFPFTVVKGVIEKLTISIPWSTLDREPVSVDVCGVEIVLGPLRCRPYDAEEERAREAAMKQQQLMRFERERHTLYGDQRGRSSSGDGSHNHSDTISYRGRKYYDAAATTSVENSESEGSLLSSPLSYMQSLLETIKRNIFVLVNGVSIRYVFDYPGLHPSLAMAASLWVDKISVTTTDDSFEGRFIVDLTMPVCKSIAAEGIKVAVHTAKKHDADAGIRATVMPIHNCAGRFEHFSRAWECTHTLMELDDMHVQVKLTGSSSAARQDNNSNANSSSADTPGGGAHRNSAPLPPHAELLVSLGNTLQSHLTFGAIRDTLALYESLWLGGLASAPYRKFLHLLSSDNSSTGITGAAPTQGSQDLRYTLPQDRSRLSTGHTGAAPFASPSPRTMARRRWAFATICVLDSVRRLRRMGGQHTLQASLVTLGALRRSYCGLWKRYQLVSWLPSLTEEERVELVRIERELTLEQATFFRCLAYAELTCEKEMDTQQKAWIAEVVQRKRGLSAAAAVPTGEKAQKTEVKRGGGRLWAWLRRGGGGAAAAAQGVDESEEKEMSTDAMRKAIAAHVASRLCTALQAEWEAGKLFLAASGLSPTTMTESIDTGNADGGDDGSQQRHSGVAQPPLLPPRHRAYGPQRRLILRVLCRSMRFTLLPAYCTTSATRERRGPRPCDTIFRHMRQRFELELGNVELFINTAQQPRDDRASISFFVREVAMGFSGVFNTPLLRCGDTSSADGSKADGGFSSAREDWLVIKQNATRTCMSVVVAPTTVLLRPLHELSWWAAELHSFLRYLRDQSGDTSSVLTSFTSSGPGTVPGVKAARPLSMRTCIGIPRVALTIRSLELLLPLSAHDFTFEDLRPFTATSTAATLPSPSHSSRAAPASPCKASSSFDISPAGEESPEHEDSAPSLLAAPSTGGGGNSTTSYAERYFLRGTPCIVLTIPMIRASNLCGSERRFVHEEQQQQSCSGTDNNNNSRREEEEEVYVRVGDDLKPVRMMCQRGYDPVRVCWLPHADIFSFPLLELLASTRKIALGVESSLEVSLDPTVLELLNDNYFKPYALHGEESHTHRAQSFITNVCCSGDNWVFASAGEVLLHGDTAVTCAPEDGRYYAELLFSWLKRKEESSWSAQAQREAEASGRASVVGATASAVPFNDTVAFSKWGWQLAAYIRLVRLTVLSKSGEDLVEVELMNPSEFPHASLPYRDAFSVFDAGSHAVELLWDTGSPVASPCVGSGISQNACAGARVLFAPDISITTALGRTLAAMEQLAVRVQRVAPVHQQQQQQQQGASENEGSERWSEAAATVAETEVSSWSITGDRMSFFFVPEAVELLETVVGALKTANFAPTPWSSSWSDGGSGKTKKQNEKPLALHVALNHMFVQMPVSRNSDEVFSALSADLETIAVGVSRNNVAGLRVTLSGTVVQALRVEEEAYGQDPTYFALVGHSSGIRGEAEQRMKFSLEFHKPARSSSSTGPAPPPSATFAAHGGHVCVYLPFVLQCVSAVRDAPYTTLMEIRHSAVCARGFSKRKQGNLPLYGRRSSETARSSLLRSQQEQERSEFVKGGPPSIVEDAAATTTVGKHKETPMAFTGFFNNVEVFIATDARQPVDVSNDDTFFYLHVGGFDITVSEHRSSAQYPQQQISVRRRVSLRLRDTVYMASTEGTLSPMVPEMQAVIDTAVVLIPQDDLSDYSYVEGGRKDVSILIRLHPHHSAASAPGEGGGGISAVPGIDVLLSPSRTAALTEAVALNLMCPTFSSDTALHTAGASTAPSGAAYGNTLCRDESCYAPETSGHDRQATPPPPAANGRHPPPAVVLMILVPSVRLAIGSADTRVFSMEVAGGARYYRASGGPWARCPVQNMQFRGVRLSELRYAAAVGDEGIRDSTTGSSSIPMFAVNRVGLKLAAIPASDMGGTGRSNCMRIDVVADSPTLHLSEAAAWASIRGCVLTPHVMQGLRARRWRPSNSQSAVDSFPASRGESVSTVATGAEYVPAPAIVAAASAGRALPTGVVLELTGVLRDISILLYDAKASEDGGAGDTKVSKLGAELATLQCPAIRLHCRQLNEGAATIRISASDRISLVAPVGGAAAPSASGSNLSFSANRSGGSLLVPAVAAPLALIQWMEKQRPEDNYIDVNIVRTPRSIAHPSCATPPDLPPPQQYHTTVNVCVARLCVIAHVKPWREAALVLRRELPVLFKALNPLDGQSSLSSVYTAPAQFPDLLQQPQDQEDCRLYVSEGAGRGAVPEVNARLMDFRVLALPPSVTAITLLPDMGSSLEDAWCLHVSETSVNVQLKPQCQPIPRAKNMADDSQPLFERTVSSVCLSITLSSPQLILCPTVYPLVLPTILLRACFPLQHTLATTVAAEAAVPDGKAQIKEAYRAIDEQLLRMQLHVETRNASALYFSTAHVPKICRLITLIIDAISSGTHGSSSNGNNGQSSRHATPPSSLASSSSSSKNAQQYTIVLSRITLCLTEDTKAMVPWKDALPDCVLGRVRIEDALAVTITRNQPQEETCSASGVSSRMEVEGEEKSNLNIGVALVRQFAVCDGDGSAILYDRDTGVELTAASDGVKSMQQSVAATTNTTNSLSDCAVYVSVDVYAKRVDVLAWVRDIDVNVTDIAIASSRRIIDFSQEVVEHIVDAVRAASKSFSPSATSALSITGDLRSVSLLIENAATVQVRSTHLSLCTNNTVESTSASSASWTLSSFTVGSVSLFAAAAAASQNVDRTLMVHLGNIRISHKNSSHFATSQIPNLRQELQQQQQEKDWEVCVHGCFINNYDAYFFATLMGSVAAVKNSVVRHLAPMVSQKQEQQQDLPRLSMSVVLEEPRLRLYATAATRAISQAGVLCRMTAPEEGYGCLEVAFPTIVAHMTHASADAHATTMKLEAEDGIITFAAVSSIKTNNSGSSHSAELTTLVEKFGVSVVVEVGSQQRTRSVAVRLSEVRLYAPSGSVLEQCAEALTQAALSITRRKRRTLVASAAIAMNYTGDGADDDREEDGGDDLQRSYRLTVQVPLLAMYLCAASEAHDSSSQARVLCGVHVHQLAVELAGGARSQVRLLQISHVESSVGAEMDHRFLVIRAEAPTLPQVSRSPPLSSVRSTPSASSSATLDPSYQVALYLRHERLLIVPEPADALQQFSQKQLVIGRLHAMEVGASPQLLDFLNVKVLSCIAAGVTAARHAPSHSEATFSLPSLPASLAATVRGPIAPSPALIEGLNEWVGRTLYVRGTSLCLDADFILGGRNGARLRFVKTPLRPEKPHPTNVITVRSVNNARLVLSKASSADGTEEPPIVIEDGLTVCVEHTSIVVEPLEGSGIPRDVKDYVLLGDRSLFMVASSSITAVSSKPAQPHSHGNNGAGLQKDQTHRPRVLVNWEVNLSACIKARLCTQHQVITLTADAGGEYSCQRVCDGVLGDVLEYVDERGEFGVSRWALAYNDAVPITMTEGSISATIQQCKSSKKVAQSEKRTSIVAAVQVVLPETRLAISLSQLSLIADMFAQVHLGCAHVGSVLGSRSHRPSFPSTTHRRQVIVGEDGVQPSFELSFTAPCMEVVVFNGFFKRELTLTVSNVALQVRGERGPLLQSSFAGSGTLSVLLCDHPALSLCTSPSLGEHGGVSEPEVSLSPSYVSEEAHASVDASRTPLRTLARLSPELVFERNVVFANGSVGGSSLTASVVCADAEFTIPTAAALRLAGQWQRCMPEVAAEFSFSNQLGVPLLLLSEVSSMEQPVRFCALAPLNFRQQEEGLTKPSSGLFRYGQTQCRLVIGDESKLLAPQQQHGGCGPSGSVPSYQYVRSLGSPVDLSELRRGTVHRVPLGTSAGGLLDAVFRLDSGIVSNMERMKNEKGCGGGSGAIHITTPVLLRNELPGRVVDFAPGSGSGIDSNVYFTLEAGAARYATLDVLRQPFCLCVDSQYSSAGSAPLVTFESVLNSFLLMPQSAAGVDSGIEAGKGDGLAGVLWSRARMPDATTLMLPLLLRCVSTVMNASSASVSAAASRQQLICLVITKAISIEAASGSSRLRPNFDVEVCVRPLISIVNYSGAILRANVLIPQPDSKQQLIDASPRSSAQPQPLSQLCSPALSDGEQFDWYPVHVSEAVSAPHALLSLSFITSSEEAEKEGGEAIATRDPLDLLYDSTNTTQFVAVASRDGCRSGALEVVHVDCCTVHVRALALLCNKLSFPLCPRDMTNRVLLGLDPSASGRGSLTGNGAQHPLLFPSSLQRKQTHDAKGIAATTVISLRVSAGGPHAKLSSPFFCSAPTFSTLLSSEDEGCVRYFLASRQASMIPFPFPASRDRFSAPKSTLLQRQPLSLIVFKAPWIVRNDHPRLSLHVRRAGLSPSEEEITVPPGESVDVCTFCTAEPEIALRYGDGKSDDAPACWFEWTLPIRLTELTASAGVPVVVKHYAAEGNDEDSGHYYRVPLYLTECVPTHYGTEVSTRRFACLTFTATPHEDQFIIATTLTSGVPLVIENRTPYLVQCTDAAAGATSGSSGQRLVAVEGIPVTEAAPLLGILVNPFTDCPACWEVPSLSRPVLALTLIQETRQQEDQKSRHGQSSNSKGGGASDGHTIVGTRQIIDLHSAATAKESVLISGTSQRGGPGTPTSNRSVVFALVTLDAELRRYHVTLTQDRALEGNQLYQPRYIAHMEMALHNCAIYLASPCVPRAETRLAQVPLLSIAKAGHLAQLHGEGGSVGVAGEGDEDADMNFVATLKRLEPDVLLLRVSDCYAATLINDRHIIAEAQAGSIEVLDCTSPAPVYPTVLHLNALRPDARSTESASGADTVATGTPCLLGKVHILRRHHRMQSGTYTHRKYVVSIPSYAYAKEQFISQQQQQQHQLVTTPVEELALHVGAITIQLHDNFLYTLRKAVECSLEVAHSEGIFLTSNRHRSSMPMTPAKTQPLGRKQHEISKGHQQSASAQRDFFISHLYVSRIELTLTLTRRSDGCYNPFEGIPLGAGLIFSSVEQAPLVLSEIRRRDVSQQQPHAGHLLTALATEVGPTYRTQLLMQTYKLVGSLEALGNPLALISGWSRGFRSLARGAAELRPLEGTRDFFRTTTSSTLHSLGLLSRLGGRTAASLSCVSGTTAVASPTSTNPGGAGSEGIVRGVASGIASGVGGVFTQPVAGANSAGVSGFVRGMATGVFGLVGRPVAGLLNGVGITAESYAQALQGQIAATARKESVACSVTPVGSAVAMPSALAGRNFIAPGSLHGRQLSSSSSSTDLPNSLAELDVRRFISARTYAKVTRAIAKRQARWCSEKDLARAVVSQLGVGNYALYAPFEAFALHTTPEEFYNWAHIALDAQLARELRRFLVASAGESLLSQLQIMGASSNSLRSAQLETPSASNEPWRTRLTAKEAAGHERARNIKVTLGIAALLKYVTLEQFISVCSIEQVKAHVSPSDFQQRCGLLLARYTCIAYNRLLFVVEEEEQENYAGGHV